ncbi:hypothetical protein KY362_04330 [Candidatus Woesearchaeota archaeon]|nr:hypothetical protein [Candidatus Woesearchaeota archaeon]
MQREAWHFNHLKTGLLYMEWKYFNVSTKDLTAFFSYAIVNPANRFGLRRIILNYNIFLNDEQYGSTTDISKDYISINDEQFVVGDHYISSKTDKTVHLKGIQDSAEWNLSFDALSDPLKGLSNYKVGVFRWEDLSWESPQPRSQVKGTIKVGNKTYKVNGIGYNDCNWGTWLGLDALWHWMQANTKNTSIMLAEIYNRKKGSIFIQDRNRTIRFNRNQYKVEHTEWYRKQGRRFPTSTFIIADNGKQKLDLEVNTLHEHTRYVKRPLISPMGGYISFQVARVSGTLTDTHKKRTIRCKGMREYTFRKSPGARPKRFTPISAPGDPLKELLDLS